MARWEDAFKEDEVDPDKPSMATLARVSNDTVVSVAEFMMGLFAKNKRWVKDEDLLSGAIASALIRVLMGMSLHGFRRQDLYKEVLTETDLTKNPEAFGAVVEHIVSTLGGTLGRVDPKHVYSISILKKEKEEEKNDVSP